MKYFIILFILLSISLDVTSQNLDNEFCKDLDNEFCKDITSNVVLLEEADGKTKFTVILSEDDTISVTAPGRNLSLIGAVKNDNVINILSKYPERQFNLLYMVNFVKVDQEWIIDDFLNPISTKLFGKDNELVAFEFPDMNTLLVSYKLSNGNYVDQLYRMTEYSVVEYERTYSEKLQLIGEPRKNKYRPSN